MHRRQAFTLVELLVVIGIIALLISILLPALNKARAAGASAACLSNVRQLASAMINYAADNRGMFPPYNQGTDSTNADSHYGWWVNKLAEGKYVGVRFKDGIASDPLGNARQGLITGGVFACPARSSDEFRPISSNYTDNYPSYGVNYSLVRNTGAAQASLRGQRLFPYAKAPLPSYATPPRIATKLGMIRRSTRLILLGDARQRNAGYGKLTIQYDDGPYGGTSWYATSGLGFPAAIHPGGDPVGGVAYLADVGPGRMRSANVAFFDGHAESVTFKDLQANRNDIWGVNTRW